MSVVPNIERHPLLGILRAAYLGIERLLDAEAPLDLGLAALDLPLAEVPDAAVWMARGYALQLAAMTLGGEDFGQYSRMLKIPGVMFKVGASDPRRIKAGKPVPGLHSDRYVPVVEPTLKTGVHAVSAALLLALQSP